VTAPTIRGHGDFAANRSGQTIAIKMKPADRFVATTGFISFFAVEGCQNAGPSDVQDGS
jgi:hypothetical protein